MRRQATTTALLATMNEPSLKLRRQRRNSTCTSSGQATSATHSRQQPWKPPLAPPFIHAPAAAKKKMSLEKEERPAVIAHQRNQGKEERGVKP
ncbi:hypothetical protein DEO72_LG5g1264 [Vigna unguiculata]|uniref:Uncharacterized protein n=1 Tax=Vigna unguiculata TaxID=3917 RepID=A0A4D6LWE0_VIGUN|nr:hypothetical protein DEO72_LG5g1264 [Vigna unguiculata]